MIELDDDSELEIDEEAIKAVLAMPSSPERAPKGYNSSRQSSALASVNASKSVPNLAERAKSTHGARYNDLFNGRLSVLE